MKVFQTYKNISDEARNCVLAIGNFDGVHRGHEILLQKAKDIAQDEGKKFAIMTFEPHPRSIFRPEDPPFRITPQEMKIERLKKAKPDFIFNIPFDWPFASQSADDFIEDILKNALDAAHVVVGYDFCFGQLRKGTPQTIQDAGIDTTTLDKICDDGDSALSSSRIRQCLRHGKMDEANAILGWEWEIRGTVVKGDQRGRELGYPTANMPLGDIMHPGYGVYATRVQIEGDEKWHAAATNIGIRPMFEVPTAQVESYIFDFDQDIYGKEIRVKPVQRLRGEAKFDSLDALKEQMAKDCDNAKAILNV